MDAASVNMTCNSREQGGTVEHFASVSRMRGSLDYRQHFAVLACAAAVLPATGRWSTLGAIGSFGVYGAMHALALVVALRASPPIWQMLSFIAFASTLSMLTVSLSLHARQFVAGLPGVDGPTVLVAFSCALGAASYGLLIRLCWIDRLGYRRIAAIALGCVCVTVAASLALTVLHSMDGSWLALAWWLAFSAGLWYQDARTG